MNHNTGIKVQTWVFRMAFCESLEMPTAKDARRWAWRHPEFSSLQTRALCWPQLGLPGLPEFPQFALPGIAAVAENYFPSAGSIQQQEDLHQVTFLRTSKDYQVIITPPAVCYCGYQSSLSTSGPCLQQSLTTGCSRARATPRSSSALRRLFIFFSPYNLPSLGIPKSALLPKSSSLGLVFLCSPIQWFSTSLTQRSFTTVPHGLVMPKHNYFRCYILNVIFY